MESFQPAETLLPKQNETKGVTLGLFLAREAVDQMFAIKRRGVLRVMHFPASQHRKNTERESKW